VASWWSRSLTPGLRSHKIPLTGLGWAVTALYSDISAGLIWSVPSSSATPRSSPRQQRAQSPPPAGPAGRLRHPEPDRPAHRRVRRLARRAPAPLPSRNAAAPARFRHLAPPAADQAVSRRRHPGARHHPHRQTGITVAAQLLTHLHSNDIAAGAAAQADLDAWLASGPSTRYTARTFVRWAVATRRLPALTFPHRKTRSSATLDQQQRLRLLNSCFGQATAPVAHRVAGILLLLYAQPVTRISRLRTADVSDNGHDMAITFDTEAVPVLPPIAQLLRQHVGDRPNMQTAANPTSPWLFPGLRAGQPLTADRMNHQLRNLGIPLRQARNSALRQLVQDMPPAVAARTLGYSQHVVQHHAEQAAVFFNSYATVHRHLRNTP